MKNKPILIVSGEPYSIFLEIFFKALKKNNFKRPLVLIVSKKLLIQQMKNLRFKYKVNLINKDHINFNKLDNKKINVINVNFEFKKTFGHISKKSNAYISKSFDIALELIKKHKLLKLINGPISKKHFLNSKIIGITEYLAKKTNKTDHVAMLIFNKKLSVSPLTTHLALKNVHKEITKKKYISRLVSLMIFIKKNLINFQELQ